MTALVLCHLAQESGLDSAIKFIAHQFISQTFLSLVHLLIRKRCRNYCTGIPALQVNSLSSNV